jgi:hypothetical protein
VTRPALASLAVLPPVGLDELVDRAALQTRTDRKYVLPAAAVEQVLTALAAAEDVRALDIGGRREFGYGSLYYDTDDLVSYHLAAQDRRRRFKVRRRSYLDTGASFVEVKTRGVRGATVKERTEDGDPGDERTAPWAGFVDDVLRRAGIDGVRGRDLRPVLRTAYRRSTLYLPATASRVTVDTHLTWSLPGAGSLALDGAVIVETKCAGGASAADRCLWRHGHRPSRISKYGTGLAALRTDLPGNRWRPVLRRHFAVPHLASTTSNGAPS